MEVVGIDIGFGFTKATNGKESLIYKSVYGESTDIQFRDKILGGSVNEEYLHIELDGQAYFVGELAERQSNVRFFTLDQTQMVANFAKILAMAALSKLVERNEPVKLVTGLPVGQYRRLKNDLARILQGRHTLTLIDESGGRTETVISVSQVKVIPQPVGTLFDLMLNDQGGAGERRFLNEKVGVIDIGFRTSDYAIANKTNYAERGSRSTELGIAHAFKIIAAKLQQESGVNVELYRLYEAVENGFIKIRGQRIDLKKTVEQVFGQLATDIATEVNQLWADDWDIDTIIISGGGGSVLAPFLAPMLNGYVLPVDKGADTRFNNVRGYCKYAKHMWSRNAPATPATSK